MEKRPALAREAAKDGNTPTMLAVIYAKVAVLRVLLEHDSSLGYEISKQGYPLLCAAADRGHVDVAQVLLKHCPDALYHNTSGEICTCLHHASISELSTCYELVHCQAHSKNACSGILHLI